MNHDWDAAEAELAAAGFSLDKIPHSVHVQHLWADGIILWWVKHHALPTAEELALDMFDEWDDPVSMDEAQSILDMLQKGQDVKHQVGDQVFIDGEVPGRFMGMFNQYAVVDIHPCIVRGQFDRIDPVKDAAVSKLLVHPDNLTIESKVRAENLAPTMQDPKEGK